MEHSLINTIIASIVVAFIFGMIAKKLNLPAIFGYLLAGVAIGPNTPGFVADVSLAKQLAEIGIILLMFGVGLHFSLKELFESRKIAIPGAIVQMAFATATGSAVAVYLGYELIPSLIFAFSLSVASTIVLIRSLEQRDMLDSNIGKIAVSWLIIEDIAMIMALVMLPVIANIYNGNETASFQLIAEIILGVFFKLGGFFIFMIIIGKRLLPWLLHNITKMESAELTSLGILSIAFGFASIAYVIFDSSLALGALFAGVILNGSDIGRKSVDTYIPMRDAFGVLFFVSVGMLFDPTTLLTQPFAVLMTFLIIVVAKSVAALSITKLFKQPREVSYAIAISLAQIGEFSFIVGSFSLTNGLISQDLYNLILAGAMLSIVMNPFLFKLYDLLIINKEVKAN